jgi:GT2 family glycosyltransferase
MAPTFSVIVPVFDPLDRFVAAGAIQRTFSRLLGLHGHFELIVVNNNPTDACPRVRDYLRCLAITHRDLVAVIEPGVNLGTARGFNTALQVADPDSEYVVFCSTDADIVDPHMLPKIHAIMQEHRSIGIAHPLSVFEDFEAFNASRRYGRRVIYRLMRHGHPSESGDLSALEIRRILGRVSTKNGFDAPHRTTPLTFAVIRRQLIAEIGAFDEGVKQGCCENDDLSYRALVAGYTVARLRGLFVNHRRLLFHHLGVIGTPGSRRLPHSAALAQSLTWWKQKWGRPYIEMYAEWRLGRFLFALVAPYFRLRRVVVWLKDVLATKMNGAGAV